MNSNIADPIIDEISVCPKFIFGSDYSCHNSCDLIG